MNAGPGQMLSGLRIGALGVLAVVFWCFTSAAVFAQNAAAAPLNLGMRADHFLDRGGSFTIDDLRTAEGAQRFTISAGRVANYGPRPNPEAVLWMRVRAPQLAAGSGWTLSFDEQRARRFSVWIDNGQSLIARVWDGDAHRDPLAWTTRYPALSFDSGELSGNTVYIKLETGSSMRTFLTLTQEDRFLVRYGHESLMFGIAIGLLAVLAFYLFAVGAAARDASALWLAAFAASYVTYLAAHQGFLETSLWPGALDASRVLSLTATLLLFATRLFYLDSFLELRRHLPVFSRIARGAGSILLVLAVYVAVDISLHGQTPLRLYTSALGVAGLIFTVVTLAFAFWKARRRALLYVLCWGPMIASGSMRLLADVAPGLGVRPFQLNSTYVITCLCFLVSGLLAAYEIHANERQRRLESEAAKERLNDIALSASDSFWESDASGVIRTIAGPAATSAGLAVGHPIQSALDRESAAQLSARIAAFAPFAIRNAWAVAPAAEGLSFELRARPCALSPDEKGYRGVIRDITAEAGREKQEQLNQRLAAVGQLAGGVAHEINNLLHPIISLSRRVAAGLAADDERRKWMDTVTDAGSRASDIVAGLLASVKADTGRDQQSAPFAEGVARAVEVLRPVVPDGIVLDVRISTLDGPVVASHKVFQLVVNLVSNALYATRGQGCITVVFAASGPGYATLSVSDDGIGMDDATQQRALEPFFTSRPQGSGTGLGLSIVHGIVQGLGGTVAIASTPGKGTTITITVPNDNPDTSREVSA